MPIRRPATRSALCAALLLGAGGRAHASPAPAGGAGATDGGMVCPGGRITEVFVDNNSVFETDGAEARRFQWAYRLANRLHVRTREEVIRRELLFHEGDCYDPAMLEDSERILRASPFIADADVFGVRQADGSYHVVVQTRDEWSTRLEAQVRGSAELSGVELREDNLLGTGQHVSAFVWDEHGERVYGASYGTTQLAGTHVNAYLEVAHTPVGASFRERLAYPFRGETGRFAVLQQVEQEEDYFEYLGRKDGARVQYLFPQRRRSFDVGAVTRLGHRGNLTLFGVGLTGEWIDYPRGVRVNGLAADVLPAAPDSSVLGLDSISDLRVVFLAGQRNVHFDRRRALDAVRGAEDVRLGAEVELGVGRSLTAFSSGDDIALDLGMFVAGDLPGGILAGGRMLVQGRRDNEAPSGLAEWRDVFSQLDAWAYWRPTPEGHHTVVAAVQGAGGWHTDVPFQLTLGSQAGLRGFTRHAYTGERRAVVTLEDRAYLAWPYPQLFDLGTAVFVDAGKSWAGRDPFGATTPLQVSVGAGLRLAFPPDSRRTYRLDVAYPVVSSGLKRSVTVSIGVGQAIGRSAAGDDPQLRRSARRLLSPSVFSFPN
ncbi:MAG: hypothetical protein JWM27_3066 [Gemmatimonadetes bacterium]|nr:hypothetical protein [Gemmatimonadota bacterium]